MKIGSLVYATTQGLGILAKAFYDNHVLTDVMIVRHGSRPTHPEWFPHSTQITDLRRQVDDMKSFCRQMDVMLFFETPFVWELIPFCRERGIKTVIIPMYECMPRQLPYQPDFFINPSLLDQQYFPDRSMFIPVPVRAEWRQRATATTFVHNAGHGGLKGRNGTSELIEAWHYIKSPAKLILRAQTTDYEIRSVTSLAGHELDYRHGTWGPEEIYREGDVFIFPEKFNGLSLPLQEAFASGMLVMCGNRFPMNCWLPRDPLITVKEYRRNCVSPRCLEFDEAVFDPQTIAATIDAWYGRDISLYSQAGALWAEDNSWVNLKPRYMEFLSR